MKWIYLLGIYLLVLVNFFRKKSRKNVWAKLGRHFPKIDKGNSPLIWIHAVSLGETKAIIPLAKKLKTLPSAPKIVLSTGTSTGYEEGEKSFPEVDWHVFLPFDLPWIMKPLMRKVRPNLIILTETDFWHYFQAEAKKQGAYLALVNGKVSKRSFGRFLKYPAFAKLLLHPIDLFCVQGDVYEQRFKALGIDASKMKVTGNIKFDGLEEDFDLSAWKQQIGWQKEDLILTLGSTHDPEEALWIPHLKQLWNTFPHLKVMLVPRHPERFDSVADLLEKEGVNYGRFSKNETLSQKNVLLVDAMRVLKKCYAVSDLAFVGGSFTKKVGGHNILEPSVFRVPVLFGPYMHSQPDFVDLLLSAEGGIQIQEETLISTVTRLLSDPQEREKLGHQGYTVIEEGKGALQRTFEAISGEIRF